MRFTAIIFGVLLALQIPAAWACGHCLEDKIASTYDHALITRALAQKHRVVFFHIDGPLVPDEATQRSLKAMAESTRGVDQGSVRVAVNTATMSLAFDPRRISLPAVQTALEKKLITKKLSLMNLRVVDSLADPKIANR